MLEKPKPLALQEPLGDHQAPGDQRRRVARPAVLDRQARQVDVLALPDDILARRLAAWVITFALFGAAPPVSSRLVILFYPPPPGSSLLEPRMVGIGGQSISTRHGVITTLLGGLLPTGVA